VLLRVQRESPRQLLQHWQATLLSSSLFSISWFPALYWQF